MDERWILAHLNELTEADFGLLARAKGFHIAHCPRSHTFFGHTPFAWRRLRALGLNICLGTDSLASNSRLSLFSRNAGITAQRGVDFSSGGVGDGYRKRGPGHRSG